MSKKLALAALASSLLLTACGGGGGGGNDAPRADNNSGAEVNVAATANGARASASDNAATAANLIDGSLDTTWISEPDSPIVVDFGAVKAIKKITLNKVAASVMIGSAPDILVELSENGVNYERSAMTTVSGGVPCTNTSVNAGATAITCEMAERNVRYIRVTTQNGKSFELQELEVIGKN